MSDNTKIEWTRRPGTIGATMNALVMTKDGMAYCLDGGQLLAPLRAHKARTYSVLNLFEESVPEEWIDAHFAVFASSGSHTFIVLTKRPERMREYFDGLRCRGLEAGCAYERRMREHFERYKQEFREGYSLPGPPTGELRALYDSACEREKRNLLPDGTSIFQGGFSGGEYHWRPWPLSNVWLGVSVEDRKSLHRIDALRQTPAALRFISVEPLLEDLGHVDLTGISWVICGGESGKGARPMHPDWARALRDQCAAAGVPFFFEQWGEWIDGMNANDIVLSDGGQGIPMDHRYRAAVMYSNGAWVYSHDEDEFESESGMMFRVGKKAAGHLLDGVEHRAFPEVAA